VPLAGRSSSAHSRLDAGQAATSGLCKPDVDRIASYCQASSPKSSYNADWPPDFGWRSVDVLPGHWRVCADELDALLLLLLLLLILQPLLDAVNRRRRDYFA